MIETDALDMWLHPVNLRSDTTKPNNSPICFYVNQANRYPLALCFTSQTAKGCWRLTTIQHQLLWRAVLSQARVHNTPHREKCNLLTTFFFVNKQT